MILKIMVGGHIIKGNDILRYLKAHKNNLKNYGVDNIALFGSYAKGNETKHSHIDFLVKFESGKKSFDNYMELNFFLKII